MCSILNVPRSTYYSKKNPKKSEREIENEKLKTAILKYYKESKCRYGAPKIKIMLSKKISNQEIELYKKLAKISKFNPRKEYK